MKTTKIIELIMQHLTYMDSASLLTDQMYRAAVDENIDEVTRHSNNRDRLVNIITQIQSQIESKLDSIGSISDGREIIEVLKLWNLDLCSWSQEIQRVDQETTRHLNHQKEETTKEIATIFKNKESLSGYNLGSMKK